MASRNPSPKSRFLAEKKLVEAHISIFSSGPAQASIDASLLQYQRILSGMNPADAQGQMAMYNRMKGAEEFVEILLNLSNEHVPTKQEKVGNLSH
jgi:hypothetical protein